MSVQKIVVVGAGMVGSRFAGDLAAALERTGSEAHITVIGEEPHAAYNRVLLSEVIAGRTALAALGLPSLPGRVTELRGSRVIAIDRLNKRVRTDDGVLLGYHKLVLATGARARLPQIPGLSQDGEPAHGVRVLRTLDDARGVIAAAAVGGRIAVLGGGVLGVEVATGLRDRGARVTLLHTGPTPMERQLDSESGLVLAATLSDRGICVVGEADVIAAARADGRLRGLALADGRFVAADTVVVTVGTEPATELASAAGLSVDRGVLVGADLCSLDDGAIAAIGDCAQPPGGTTGLIGPGWEQARQLARQIAGEAPSAPANGATSARAGERDIVRLKAGQISAVTLGDPRLLSEQGPLRVVSLQDHTGRRNIRIATDGRSLRAAVCVGAPGIAAELQVTFERGLPIPADPSHLLIDRSLVATPTGGTSINKIPDTATLCRCNGVTKGQVIAAYRSGDRSVDEVAQRTRATTGCGGCTAAVSDALVWLASADPDQANAPASAATASASGHQGPVGATGESAVRGMFPVVNTSP